MELQYRMECLCGAKSLQDTIHSIPSPFLFCSAGISLQWVSFFYLWLGGWEGLLLLWSHCPETCGILVPGPGIKPTSPALKGGFLTTGPPAKHQLAIHFANIFLELARNISSPCGVWSLLNEGL